MLGFFDSRLLANKKRGEKKPTLAWIISSLPLKSHLLANDAALHRSGMGPSIDIRPHAFNAKVEKPLITYLGRPAKADETIKVAGGGEHWE